MVHGYVGAPADQCTEPRPAPAHCSHPREHGQAANSSHFPLDKPLHL